MYAAKVEALQLGSCHLSVPHEVMRRHVEVTPVPSVEPEQAAPIAELATKQSVEFAQAA